MVGNELCLILELTTKYYMLLRNADIANLLTVKRIVNGLDVVSSKSKSEGSYVWILIRKRV